MADCSVCPICHDSFEKPKFLHCRHTFCESCLDNYMDNTNRKESIICPLCRAKTQFKGNDSQFLMDNYIAPHITKSRKITVCSDCNRVARVQLCSHCDAKYCDACFASHETSIKTNDRTQGDFEGTNSDVSEEGDPSIGMQGFLLSETTQTKFCFKLQHKIVVPNEDNYARRMDLNVSNVVAYSDGKCFVSPNCSNVLINYNLKGEENGRTYIAVDVVDITMGMRGHLLLIGNQTNLVFECENGNLRKTIETDNMVPFVLASMNNGNVVVLGVRHKAPNDRGIGVVQIYKYYGQLVREIPGTGDGYELLNLRSVEVNMKNNDIYVGDRDTGIVHLFKENGTYITSYSILEAIVNLDLGINMVISVGQMPICCYPTHDIVLVSCISTVSQSIHVLSPRLELLGFFSCYDRIGIPAGLSMDEMDRLYVGDAVDGIVRVYTMEEFRNNIYQT